MPNHVAVVALLAITSLNAPRLEAQPQATTVLVGATVIDGTGAPGKAGQTIVITGGKVAALFADGRGRVPVGAVVHDLRGKFVIPGLIDGHVHVATDPSGRDASARARLGQALSGGVTTVRDMAGDAVALAELAAECRDATHTCPRLFYAALFAGPTFFTDPRAKASAHGGTPGGQPWQRAITPSTDLVSAIREAKATGATGIKMYADLNADLATALTREAHKQGMQVWAHATLYPARPSELARAGVQGLSHTMLLAWDVDPDMPARYADRTPRAPYENVPADSPALISLFGTMKTHNTILDATLWVTQQIEGAPAGAGGFAEPRRAAAWAFDVTGRAHAAGVKVGAGTDGLVDRSPDGLPNIHTEMELLVTRAGLTPLEAIRSATSINAELLGRSADLGRIAPGMWADLVVLDADPARDIRNSRRIAAVYKAGVRHQANR